MKKFVVKLSLMATILSVLILSGCQDIRDYKAQGEGNVTISVSDGNARTLLPKTNFTGYRLCFSGPVEQADIPLNGGETSRNVTLAEGQWEITAKAFVTIDGTGYEAASGVKTITVGADNIQELTITVTAKQAGEKGWFSYSVTHPMSALEEAELLIYPLGGSENSGQRINLKQNQQGRIQLDPGYYLMFMKLYNGYQAVIRSEVVHIWSNMETEYAPNNLTFTDIAAIGGTATVTVNGQNIGVSRITVYEGSNYLGEASVTGGAWSAIIPNPATNTVKIGITTSGGGHYISEERNFNLGQNIAVTVNITAAIQTDAVKIGRTLTAEVTGITPAQYNWKSDGANVGTGSTYIITGADAGKTISCEITSNTGSVITAVMPEEVPYNIVIEKIGGGAGDFVSFNAVTDITETTGHPDDTIAIHYKVGNTAHENVINFIEPESVRNRFTAVNNAIEGNIGYTVDGSHGDNGTITCVVEFEHTDLLLDIIEFADSHVSKTYGVSSFTVTPASSGAGAGAISYSSSDASVATVNSSTGAVTILKIGETRITATKASDGTYEGTFAFYMLNVAPLQLTVNGTDVTQTKIYDGNTTATVTNAGTLGNRVGSDTVTVSAVATYNNASAGSGKTITVVYSISGASSSNYIKPVNQTFTGTINQRQLTISGTNVTLTKIYNGSTTATVVSAGTLGNRETGDTVNVSAVATYDTANAGTGKTITIVYTISGASSANYIKPANSTVSGTITKANGGTLASAPTASSKTASAITVNAVTISPPATGQTVEYAIATTQTVPSSGWQDSVTFSGLVSNTDYYVFARAKENTNYNAGIVRVSLAIRTDRSTSIVPHVIVFEGFSDEVIDLQATGVEIRRGDSLTVTITGSYDSYTWLADGVPQSGTSNSITITIAPNETIGEHQIMALVFKGGAPYSKQLIYRVAY